jgi:predicted kinase
MLPGTKYQNVTTIYRVTCIVVVMSVPSSYCHARAVICPRCRVHALKLHGRGMTRSRQEHGKTTCGMTRAMYDV